MCFGTCGFKTESEKKKKKPSILFDIEPFLLFPI